MVCQKSRAGGTRSFWSGKFKIQEVARGWPSQKWQVAKAEIFNQKKLMYYEANAVSGVFFVQVSSKAWARPEHCIYMVLYFCKIFKS